MFLPIIFTIGRNLTKFWQKSLHSLFETRCISRFVSGTEPRIGRKSQTFYTQSFFNVGVRMIRLNLFFTRNTRMVYHLLLSCVLSIFIKRIFDWIGLDVVKKVGLHVLGSTTDCNIVRLATTRATTTTSPPRCRKSARKPIHSIIKRDKRARHTIPYFPTVITFHVKNATQHLHQNCLYTLTSSYRRLANNYTLLLNATTTYTICRPGVESPYTSICLSFGNSLYVIQRWLNIYRYARIY